MNQTGISETDYRRLTGFIQSEWGLEFPPAKRVLFESRLGKRTRALGLASISAYCEFLRSPEGRSEFANLIDAVTTHKTDFFREPGHFTYLTGKIVPTLANRCGAGVRRPLRIWSSACSTGEEPYTIAMVLEEFSHTVSGGLRYEIVGTDISTVVLETALAAVYSETVVAPVPEAMRKLYLMRSRDRSAGQVRIVPELRQRISFRQLNLLDSSYHFDHPPDVVFCRNVMIYFERAKQQTILDRICRSMNPDGYLLMGHSESLNGLDLPLVQEVPTVYRRRNA